MGGSPLVLGGEVRLGSAAGQTYLHLVSGDYLLKPEQDSPSMLDCLLSWYSLATLNTERFLVFWITA